MPSLPPGDLPNPGIDPRSPTLQADSLPSEPQRKPKNPGMGSLLLLQGFFLTQELNRGLLHCRRILYQLSYERCPTKPWRTTSKPQAREVKAVPPSTHLPTIHPTIHTLNQSTNQPPIHSSIHTHTHLINPSFIHSFTHLLPHPPIHPANYPTIHSSLHPSNQSSTHLTNHPIKHSYIHPPTYLLTHPTIHPLTHPPTQLSNHPSTQLTNQLFIHPSMSDTSFADSGV